MERSNVIAGYAADAAELVPLFEAIDYAEVFAPIADLLPTAGGRMLDVGAGSGRGTADFVDRGYSIVAAEPVAAFVEAGRRLHPSPRIRWLQDQLPELASVRALRQQYDLITLVSVWQHLAPQERKAAMETLATLAAPGARLILSLRHGPGSPMRPCFPCDPEETIASAQAAGLQLIGRRPADSVQQKNRDAGVTWTWLVFDQGQSRIH